jgi:hypothetical protein
VVAKWWRAWRDRVFVDAMITSYTVSGVLIVFDLVAPERGLRGVGIALLIVAGILTLIWKIDSCVGKVWDAGGRAALRQVELEQSQDTQLAAVRTLPRRQ